MAEGGKKLVGIKNKLKRMVKKDANAKEVDDLAVKLIESVGGRASFKMEVGYSWATCVNLNSGLVHGIPKKEIVFKKGDIVSVDVGIYYKGFHTDTSFSVGVMPSGETRKFLEVGKAALKKAIKKAHVGNRIYDISKVIQETLFRANLSPVKALVGHGIGRGLHEEPQIPCFTEGARTRSPKILKGMVLAIEVMYTKDNPDLTLSKDGWTISTKNGKISALFEETVAVTSDGPIILTA